MMVSADEKRTSAVFAGEMEEPKSITFYFPYQEVSGVPVLFVRMAKHLAERHGVRTHVIDYPDGYMARTLGPDSVVGVARFKIGAVHRVPPDTLLVMQSVLPYTLPPELRISPETRMVFWTLHPFNLIPPIVPRLRWAKHFQARAIWMDRFCMTTLRRGLGRRLNRFVQDLHQRNSIFFMDRATLENTSRRLKIRIPNPAFLPVPCDDNDHNLRLERKDSMKGGIAFGWLGRLSDFKIHILIHAIHRLSRLAERRHMPMTMHIVGDGPDAKRLNSLKLGPHCFSLTRAGVLTGDELDSYLLQNVDVLLAMGTSALEGAKLGIPTILLDMSYGPLSGPYKFQWLFDKEEFNLGDFIGRNHLETHGDSLEEILDAALGRYSDLSRRTHEYFRRNHSLSSVCKKFVNLARAARFCYRDIDPWLVRKGFARRACESLLDLRRLKANLHGDN